MTRAFLGEEVKRTFLPGVVIALGLALLAVVMRRALTLFFGNADKANDTMTIYVAFALILIVAGAGSATFSQGFRQGPLKLLESLPLPRWRVWVVRLMVCLMVVVSSAVVLAMAQPAVVQGGAGLWFVMSAALLMFTVGAWVSPILPTGPLAASFVTVACTGLLIAGIQLLSFVVGDVDDETSVNLVVWLSSVGIFVLLSLRLSFHIFMRGEFDLSRRRLRNLLLIAVWVVGTAVVLVLSLNSGLSTYGREWIPRTDRPSVSPDGSQMSFVLQKGRNPLFSKVVVIDLKSGRVVKEFRQSSIGQTLWLKDGSFLVASEGSLVEHLLGLGYGAVHLTQILPTEVELFRRGVSEDSWLENSPYGTLLAFNTFPLMAQTGQTSAVRFKGKAAPEVVISQSWKASPALWLNPWGDALVLTSRRRDSKLLSAPYVKDKEWLIRETVRDVSLDLGPFRFPDQRSVQVMLKKLRETAPSASGRYVWSDMTYEFDGTCWLYFLDVDTNRDRGRLLARRLAETDWREIIPVFQLSELQKKELASKTAYFVEGEKVRLHVGVRNGLAARSYDAGLDYRVFLADAVTGDRFEFQVETGNPANAVSVRFSYDGSAPLMFFQGSWTYRYERGKGAPAVVPVRLPTATAPEPYGWLWYRASNGIRVYRAPSGTFTAVQPDGTARRLWPQ